MAATVGYSFGNLLIAGYDLPWENEWEYPIGLARPLDVIIGASNGASDYGNKFGEPVVAGWARSFGQIVHNHRREWVKVLPFYLILSHRFNLIPSPLQSGIVINEIIQVNSC